MKIVSRFFSFGVYEGLVSAPYGVKTNPTEVEGVQLSEVVRLFEVMKFGRENSGIFRKYEHELKRKDVFYSLSLIEGPCLSKLI